MSLFRHIGHTDTHTDIVDVEVDVEVDVDIDVDVDVDVDGYLTKMFLFADKHFRFIYILNM